MPRSEEFKARDFPSRPQTTCPRFLSYEPDSYGTLSLVEVVRNPRSTRADAIAAAKELSTRSIAAVPEESISDIITNRLLRAEARVEIIQLLTDRSLSQFKYDYLEAVLHDPNERVAELAGIAYYEWAEDDQEVEKFLLALLKESSHAALRTRSARALKNMGPQYLSEMIEQLKHEKSASAAYALCEALVDYRTPESIEALNEIANNIERSFVTDSYLGDDRRIRSEDVRAFCIKPLESMVVAPF